VAQVESVVVRDKRQGELRAARGVEQAAGVEAAIIGATGITARARPSGSGEQGRPWDTPYRQSNLGRTRNEERKPELCWSDPLAVSFVNDGLCHDK